MGTQAPARPRDKGGTRGNHVATEYASSNSTTAMFLGGQQKSWMAGPNGLMSPSQYQSRTSTQRPKLPSNGPLRDRTNQPAPTISTCNQSNAITDTRQPVSDTGPVQTPISRPPSAFDATLQDKQPPASINAETVLPSPAPSEERRSNSLQPCESEANVPNARAQTGSTPLLPSNIIQEIYGNTPGWNNGPRNAQSPMTPPLSTTMIHPGRLPSANHPRPVGDNRISNDALKRKLSELGHDSGNAANSPIAVPSGSSESGPPHANRNNRHRPTDEEMHTFYTTVVSRLKWATQHRSTRGETEMARLTLVQTACAQHDYFYLHLHQVYCMNSQLRLAIELGPEHLRGLELMVPLLLSNSEHLAEDAVTWLAWFPRHLTEMTHDYQLCRDVLKAVKACLEQFSRSWVSYIQHCKARLYPPLVDEMVRVLGIKSPVFQNVVFRAVLKDIWVGELNDARFQENEKIFRQNQQAVWQRQNQLTEAQQAAFDRNVVMQYTHLRRGSSTRQGPSTANSQAGSPRLNNTSRPPSVQPRERMDGATNSAQNRGSLPSNIDTEMARNNHLGNVNGGQPRPLGFHPQNRPMLARQVPPILPSSPQIQSPSSNWFPTGGPAPAGSASFPLPPQQTNISNPQRLVPPSSASLAIQWTTPWINNSHLQSLQSSPPARHLPGPQSAAPVRQPVPPAGFLQSQGPGSNTAPQTVHQQLMLPPIGRTLSTTALPNPSITALHQYRACSPVLTVTDECGSPIPSTKHYRYLEHVSILRDRLKVGNRQHIEWKFPLDSSYFTALSGFLEGSIGPTLTRAVKVGSLSYRIRCIDATKVKDCDRESSWAVANQIWPAHVTVVLNEEPLDIRKKIHHGKDLPIDVTAWLRQYTNTLSVSIIRGQKYDPTEYAIGLERIGLLDTKASKAMMGTLSYDDARQRILKRFQNSDTEVEIVDASVTITMVDPYTSSIWDVPMRGKTCRHDQCFDCDTFFQTRSSKKPGQPCEPDQFKCPICGADARPQSLVKDEFLESIRGELGSQNRLDAKEIIMQQDGSWRIKEEEKTGEAGDGAGSRSSARLQTPASATNQEGGDASRRATEVIELDDD
ncbi:MAG: hypothetical protein Q9174_000586 [Haloplaca sp. 1 TL-2023]